MRIVIVGAGEGFDIVRDYQSDSDTEIWVVSSIYPVLQGYRVNKVFEIHKEQKWQHIDYHELGNRLVLPYTLLEYDEAQYSSLSVLEKTYGPIFSSTVSWMVAEALQVKNLTELVLLGIDMDFESEYSKQRDGLFFLLGFAKARNVTITIPETSKINIFGEQYGF